jgi:deoxyribose-phosphate aldolase
MNLKNLHEVNHFLLSLIDLTSLNETDTPDTIADLCRKATTPVGDVAAVCVLPKFVALSGAILKDSPVNVATVANFPSGLDKKAHVIATINKALEDGVNEIDVVLPYTQYLLGNKEEAITLIESCREIIPEKVLLKVILETGKLNAELIAEATADMIALGVDFIKTSTGKIAEGATLMAAGAILKTIQANPSPLKKEVGIKISGGVKTATQAMQYIDLARAVMGPGWVSQATFRIGASQLVDQLLALSEI